MPILAPLRRHLLLCASLAAALALPEAHAWAGAFQLKENSAADEGDAFAGAASAADTPATVFANPAGMTQLPGVQVALGGSVIAPSFAFSGTATNALGLPIAGTNDQDGGHTGFVPYGYATYQISHDFAVGLGVTSPFGLTTYYGPEFIGRYQADKTELETLDINPSLAWRVTPWLSLGAGVSANYAIAQFSTAINSQTVALEALGEPLPLADGLFRLRGDNWAFGYNFGALLTPAPGTQLGLTYRSRIQHDFSGTATFDMPLPLSLSPAFRDGPATAKLVLPDTATISLTQHLAPRWTGYATMQWTDWSLFKNLNVYRTDGTLISGTQENYRNGFFVSLGASYQVNDRLVLRAGTAFDKTPVSAAYLTARVPDANRYWLAVGASYRVLAHATVDFGYAHIFVDNSSIHEYSATDDLLAGSFSNQINVVAVGAHLAF